MALKHKKQSGFSLVELSVTLVIVGILIAGITSGLHLMKAAKINKVISEITGYTEAVENFRLKYHGWPGDLPNAVSIWGVYDAGPPITGAHNGDGDEVIELFSWERAAFFRQLMLANMIVGEYTGNAALGVVIGENVPGSVIDGAGYIASYGTIYSQPGNILYLSSLSGININAALSSADANLIDTKIDDGLASTGNIAFGRGSDYDGVAGRCVDDDTSAASANAILTDHRVSCILVVWLSKG